MGLEEHDVRLTAIGGCSNDEAVDAGGSWTCTMQDVYIGFTKNKQTFA
jgi:hypothetical protein